MGLIKKDNISFDDILDIFNNLKTNNLLSTETESEYQLDVIKANLDIELNINTNMKDVYNDKSQEIIFMRKVNGKDVKETVKVPLIGDRIIYEGLGDSLQNSLGNLIVNVDITNNMKYKKRENDLIIRFEISLYQLFNGLVFSFIHLDDKEITVKIDECFKYNFDGTKFKYTIPSKGIPLSDGTRGNLVIHFILSKDNNFDEKLLRFFG
jgi:DnaJ-class molecular chaperone